MEGREWRNRQPAPLPGHILPAKEDGFGRIIVEIWSTSLPLVTFTNSLRCSVKLWRSKNKKDVVTVIPKEYAPVAIKEGFSTISEVSTFVFMILNLELGDDEPSPLPANASNQVGATDEAACTVPPKVVENPMCSDSGNSRMAVQPQAAVTQVGKSGHAPDKSTLKKRKRGPDWTVEEKFAMLSLYLEWLNSARKPGRSWSRSVSKLLFENNGFDRSFVSCQGQWDSLWKAFKTIFVNESKIGSGTSSFWAMDESQRRAAKLPKEFQKDLYALVEQIISVQKNPSREYTTAIHQSSSSAPAITNSGTNFPAGTSDAANTFSLGTQDPTEAALALLEPILTNNQQHESENAQNMPHVDDHLLIRRIAPLVKKQIEDAVSSVISEWRVSELARMEDTKKYERELKATTDEQLNVIRQHIQLIYNIPVPNSCEAGTASPTETFLVDEPSDQSLEENGAQPRTASPIETYVLDELWDQFP